MKRKLFAIGLPPADSHSLRLLTVKQLREAVGTRSVP
jgi:hypothetical protein